MELLTRGAQVPDPLQPYLDVDRTHPRHECWVTGHMVAGLDGTAAIDGRVGALSTAPDQSLFRRMRQIADVVLIGAETVRREGNAPIRFRSGSAHCVSPHPAGRGGQPQPRSRLHLPAPAPPRMPNPADHLCRG